MWTAVEAWIQLLCKRFKVFIRESIDGIICKIRQSYLINITGFSVKILQGTLENIS